MSEKQEHNQEPQDFPAVCKFLHGQLDDTLRKLEKQMDRQHDETRGAIKELTLKVQNGLLLRVVEMEKQFVLFRSERTAVDTARRIERENDVAEKQIRLRRFSKWETAFITAAVGVICTGLWFGITHYIESQSQLTRDLLNRIEARK